MTKKKTVVKVVTKKQAAASRANGRKSTGPRTAAGRALVKMNATRHGLTAAAVVVPGIESFAEWERFRAGVVESLAPAGPMAECLAERAAEIMWRLRRATRFESISVAADQAQLQVPPRPKSDGQLLDEVLDDDQDGMTDEEFLANREDSIAEAVGLGDAYSDDPEATAADLADWRDDVRVLRTRIALNKAIAAARKAGVSTETADRVARYEAHLSRELTRVLDQLDRLRGGCPKMPDPPPA